ncbi:sigma-70 family RNA polymerase sigma factor [Piscinibacter koreensis]|uniref:Sigma-70 family RNA polymerase sigma factor n=1 Tax=Piscinibacter koreensis TaxID=2742824 RepID=A0A7Y6NP61_9BURK|nr:sigma-70 family RNA polymerase sigma factor [Schlegelella koreensis]NUZ06792.1 sigma-70 family RNA polymerase sigma factor [Schlegelella koreensis]
MADQDSNDEQHLRALFVRALDGDGLAYAAFLKQIARRLRAYLRRRLYGWPDDVEDLVQECLLAMHNQRGSYLRDQSVVAWAQAIARHKLIDLLRAKAAREQLHHPLDDDAEDILLAVDDHEAAARHDVLALLGELPDRHRLPIQHVKLEGLSVAEAARRTGMSESAVKVGVHRGLKALAARCGARRLT